MGLMNTVPGEVGMKGMRPSLHSICFAEAKLSSIILLHHQYPWFPSIRGAKSRWRIVPYIAATASCAGHWTTMFLGGD